MSLIFYYAPMTSATRIHWALEELEMPYEKKKIDLASGDQKSAEYLALNPNGKVPLVVEDGVAIYESLAILIYLGERYGVDKGLFPKPGMERAESLTWLVWAQVTLAEAGGRIMRNTSERFPEDERNAKAAEAAKNDLHAALAIVERALEGKEYLVGGKFSYADLAIAGYVPFFARIGADLSPFKNIQAWIGRCTARPALAKAMQG
jgi:glutathione S-transferase